MHLEIRHIRALLALVEEQSITRAARRLGVAQPALSAQLHRIEQHLGTRLFERTAKGIALTTAGATLLPHLRAVDDGMRALEGRGSEGCRRCEPLRVGIESAALLDVLENGRSAGGRPVQIAVADRLTACRSLGQGALDFVTFSELTTSTLTLRPTIRVSTILEQPVGLLAPATSVPVDESPRRLADLDGAIWASRLQGNSWHEALVDAARARGFAPSIRYLAASDQELAWMISSRSVLALGSMATAFHYGLRFHRLDLDLSERVVAAWNPESCPSATAFDLAREIHDWYLLALEGLHEPKPSGRSRVVTWTALDNRVRTGPAR